EIAGGGVIGYLETFEQPVGEELRFTGGELDDTAVEVGVILLFELVKVIQLGFVEALQDGALFGGAGTGAGELVEVEGVQLELDGVADGLEAHGVAELAVADDLEVAAAEEAFAVGDGEAGGELEAAFAAPGVADLGAADLVVFHDAAALRTSRWHV